VTVGDGIGDELGLADGLSVPAGVALRLGLTEICGVEVVAATGGLDGAQAARTRRLSPIAPAFICKVNGKVGAWVIERSL
jgi:hypothetical protein